MKYLTLTFFLFPLLLQSQVSHRITGLSDQYSAKVEIEKGDEVFIPGTITIYDKKNNQPLISVSSEELTLDLDDQNTPSEIPYDKQWLIIHEDFNFDGTKDFALLEGQNSCYHQASYEVFLASENGFVSSPAFSELAQTYCGMFRIDPEKKTILTNSKSGCCWHEYSEFVVENNKPKVIKIIEEDAMNHPYSTTTTKTLKAGEMEEKVETIIDGDFMADVLSFNLAKNGKRVVLFQLEGSSLNYVLLKPNELVEFNFPKNAFSQEADFNYNETGNKTDVKFSNGDASYEVYQVQDGEKIGRIGILVRFKGKVYDLVGDLKTVEGSLKDLKSLELENVVKN